MVLRIFKTIATSGFLTALDCTKFVFGRGSLPGTQLEKLTALAQAPTWFKDATCNGEGEREVKGKIEGKGKIGNGRVHPPPYANLWICF